MTKSILITGCSSGIGYDAAHAMKRRGWRVFAACRKAEDCARLKAEGLDAPRIDYEDEATIHSGLAEVLEATGGTLNAVFNNGAYAVPGAVEDLPTDALRAIFEANFFGWHTLNRALIPVMRAQGYGRIVQCSSVLGFVPARARGAYVASKYALEGLTDVLRLEMADTPIKVILIEPGPVTSLIRQNAQAHFEKWVDWESSPRKGQYEAALMPRLYDTSGKKDPFELPPSAVSEKLKLALTVPNPKPRYFVTTPTYLMAAARRILPGRALDWLTAKS